MYLPKNMACKHQEWAMPMQTALKASEDSRLVLFMVVSYYWESQTGARRDQTLIIKQWQIHPGQTPHNIHRQGQG